MGHVNRRIVLTKRPNGMPTWDDFQLQTVDIPELKGEYLLVKVLSISIDPAMRGWMNNAESYLPPVGIGEVMRAFGIGQVIRSTMKGYQEADLVTGIFGLQEYAVVHSLQGIDKVPQSVGLPINAMLSVLGLTGLTAYFGLLKIGQPQPGDTVLVSAAAGATGSIVGQIAKLMNCKVIGIAGSDDKCNYLVNDLKFDGAINYKEQDSMTKKIAELCPEGVDIYFDNVGGDILDAALGNLAFGARVVICGAISQYNAKQVQGPSNYTNLLVKRASMKGFLVLDYAKEYSKAQRLLATWVHKKLITFEVTEFNGLESWIDSLSALFTGKHQGKCILNVGSPIPTSAM